LDLPTEINLVENPSIEYVVSANRGEETDTTVETIKATLAGPCTLLLDHSIESLVESL
jgi:methionine synthase II (cobalamin-independent)